MEARRDRFQQCIATRINLSMGQLLSSLWLTLFGSKEYKIVMVRQRQACVVPHTAKHSLTHICSAGTLPIKFSQHGSIRKAHVLSLFDDHTRLSSLALSTLEAVALDSEHGRRRAESGRACRSGWTTQGRQQPYTSYTWGRLSLRSQQQAATSNKFNTKIYNSRSGTLGARQT